MGTMHHTQLYSVTGRPFLVSSFIVTCFNMVGLKTSVRASDDEQLQRIQEIARLPYGSYDEEPELLDEFSRLICDSCVFVDSWSAPEITPSTYRLYGKKHPAKEASKRFVEQIRQRSDIGILREHCSDDVENPRLSHCDWTKASESTKASLDNKVKEPRTLLLYRGAVYEFTYNDRGKFSQSQIGLLYDVPLQIDLDRCKKFNILVAPPGVKDITWDRDATKQYYLDLGFVEQKVGLAPERTQFLSGDLQAQR